MDSVKEKEFWTKVESMLDEQATSFQGEVSESLGNRNEEKELILGKGNMAIRKKTEYGFPVEVKEKGVPDTSEVENEIALLEAQIENHNEKISKKDALAEKLGKFRLNPIAIVSYQAFVRICRQLEILTFRNISKDGRVSTAGLSETFAETFLLTVIASICIGAVVGLWQAFVGGSQFAWLMAAGTVTLLIVACSRESKSMLISALVSITGIVHFLNPLDGIDPNSIGRYITGDIVFFVGTFVCLIIIALIDGTEDRLERIIKGMLNYFYKITVPLLTKKRVIRMLWPEWTDEGCEGESVSVMFPEAPREFMEVIRKIEESELSSSVAAYWDAVEIDKKDIIAAKSREIEALKLDPIVCIIDGDHVAIMGQFGNIPNERKALEHIRKEIIPSVLISKEIAGILQKNVN